MAGPDWARWVFALVFAAIGVHCAVRLGAHRASRTALSSGERTVAAAHLVMAAGMTVMFVPVATPVPPVWWAWGFGVHTAWLGVHIVRSAPPHTAGGGVLAGRGHLLSHVLAAAVMTFLFAAMPADALSGAGISHAGHLAATSAVFAVVGWLAAAYFLVDMVHAGVRVAAAPPGQHALGPAPGAPTARPGGVLGLLTARADLPLRVVMGLGMSYMLLTML
ncbi:MAG TPA: DUF5134 domain-containing protein [Pseudonocardia sp.]|jgi:hypothetical protein|nr:DUF5134 domain-containing protein [Pseudonocardia sp.]